MANNHLNRLLRLARRTGDRLIVTDERGSEEPIVILPLDEYEALIDGAFGPSELPVMAGPISDRSAELLEEEGEWGSEAEESLVEDIHIDEIAALESEMEEGEGQDEADVDESALQSLWTPPNEEKPKENAKEPVKNISKSGTGGEEDFYLESID